MRHSSQNIDVRWLLFSLASAIVLSRFSRGGLCSYMFTSISWLFLWTLIAQTYEYGEENNRQTAVSVASSIVGWVIGTVLVWKIRNTQHIFFD